MRPGGVKRLFAFPFRKRTDVRADVGEEFAFHLDMRRDELQRLGRRPRRARGRFAIRGRRSRRGGVRRARATASNTAPAIDVTSTSCART